MKYKLLPILLILLCACSSKSTTITVNDPLSYSVNIKDDTEYILVKEGTSVEEATQIILDNLDIETNADSYEFDWYGEALSNITREDFEKEETPTWSLYNDTDKANFKISGEITQVSSQENTLNHDSFRPIELIFDFTKDGETETYYKQILLCVAKEDVYNAVLDSDDIKVEDVYKTVNSLPLLSMKEYDQIAREEKYSSNLINYYFE